jgi:phosphatidylglycerophosphate synthase
LLSWPNLLSLSRIPLGGLFWLGIGPSGRQSVWAFVVMGLAAASDVLDGHLARRNAARARARAAAAAHADDGSGTGAAAQGDQGDQGDGDGWGAAPRGSAAEAGDGGTGAWLDPICDKLFVAAVLGAIIVHRHPQPWLLVLIVSRELAQLPLSLVYRFLPILRTWLRYDFRASGLGKAATVAQFLAITALILDHPSILIFAGIAFVLGMAALVDYVRRAVVIGRSRLDAGRDHRGPGQGGSG